MMIRKIAWRNLWRNRRRTLVSISSIFFAVILAILMRSMQEGSYNQMIDTAARFYMGYGQVHQQGYWADKTINQLMEDIPTNRAKINAVENISSVFGRLETFGMAATDSLTKGVMVIGTEPEGENQLSKLAQKLVKGQYLTSNGPDIMVSEGLADFLHLKPGDTLAILGQGYHGATAAGLFAITGIIRHPNPQLNNQTIYMNLPTVQEFVSAPQMLTSYILNMADIRKIDHTLKEARKVLNPEDYEVMSWEELSPEMVNMIEADRAGGVIMVYILYIVIAFGIFSTILMMTIEREREFGILTAVGMEKGKIYHMMILEALFIGMLGMGASVLVGYPILWYMEKHPIPLTGDMAVAMEKMGMEALINFSASMDIIWPQGLAIFLIMLVCTLYPIYHIAKLKTVEAIHA
ncbi:ABC transporter permease [Persicobacter diffluens]|uniref:Transporter n=1 Tax=Persicobacter diffluens TaxID=981 RepID=A0AAN4W350_9BACT|nr:transporter [Persicobacter diffluens]